MSWNVKFDLALPSVKELFHFISPSDNSAGQQKSDSHPNHSCSIVWSLELVSIASLFKILIFPGSSLMDGIQDDLREPACCSSSVRYFQSFLLLIFFLPTSWLACNWEDFKGSWAFALPTDASPYSLIWSLQIRGYLSKFELLCSAPNWCLTSGVCTVSIDKIKGVGGVLQVKRSCVEKVWFPCCKFKM